MDLDTSAWTRILISSILIAVIISSLKIIFGMISEWVFIISIIIPALLNRPENIKDTIFMGFFIGLIAGILLSVFYLGFLFFATIIFIIFSIIGLSFTYYIIEKRN